MWQYKYTGELQHHGIKGMKWGVRRSQAVLDRAAGRKSSTSWEKEAKKMTINNLKHPILTNKADRESKAADSFGNRLRRNTLYQNTKDLQDVNARFEKLLSQKQASDNQKRVRKETIEITQKEISDTASRMDKFVYNEAMRRKAAKYVVDNNMPVTEAIKKSKGNAWRNSVIAVAAFGAIEYLDLIG